MNKKLLAIELMTKLFVKCFCADKEVAIEVAERIYKDIIDPAVEQEREEWILLSKAAPNRPDGRGLDS